MQCTLIALVLFAVSTSVFAQEASSITRRDGFLLIWEAIDRPAEETRETPYVDLPKGDRGSFEITYAKRRGLLDNDVSEFRPDDALTTGDALIWLLRTRNVAYPDDISLYWLPTWLQKYPLASIDDVSRTLTAEELTTIMRRFDQMLREEVHEVSFYAEKFHGKGTAFGEAFDMYAMTAAHRTFPHNTLVKVTNVQNGKSVIVRINDRGPFVEGRDMDLSLGAFTTIAERSKGVINARFERMGTGTEEAKDDEEAKEAKDSLTESATGSSVPAITTMPACPEPTYFFRRIGGGVALHRGMPDVLPINQELRLSAPKAFVVRSIIGPDGQIVLRQDFVLQGEIFSWTPTSIGKYKLLFSGITGGRISSMEIDFLHCAISKAD